MSENSPMEVFVLLLSDVRRKTERSIEFYRELTKLAEQPDVKQALESRGFIAENTLEKIDQAFKLINQKPGQLSAKAEEAFIEDFRKQVAEIKSTPGRRLYVLAKAIQLSHLRIGEYAALIAAADMTGHFGVGVLLESCLADNLAFVERTRRLVRRLVEIKAAASRGA
jgi:ferritin-like metal-binding protein YciE